MEFNDYDTNSSEQLLFPNGCIADSIEVEEEIYFKKSSFKCLFVGLQTLVQHVVII